MSIVFFTVFALLFLRIAHVMRHRQAVPVSSGPVGLVVLVERRWLSGAAKVAIGLLFGVGAGWATYGSDPIGSQWWVIVPSMGLTISGLMDLGFRCRHIFYLRAKRVWVGGRRLGCAAFERGYDYSQLRWVVEDRSPGRGPWFSAVVHYPDFNVSIYSATDESKVQERMKELRFMLQFEAEPNQAPQPATGLAPGRG